MNEEERQDRVEALGHAVRHRIKSEDRLAVVKTAERYLEFLQGMSVRPKSAEDCHFSVRQEETEEGLLWVGRCAQFPNAVTYSKQIDEAIGLVVDAVETLTQQG